MESAKIAPTEFHLINDLPLEIVMKIISHMRWKDVLSLRETSKTYKDLADDGFVTSYSKTIERLNFLSAPRAMKFVEFFNSTNAYQQLIAKNQNEMSANEMICLALTTTDIKTLDPLLLAQAIKNFTENNGDKNNDYISTLFTIFLAVLYCKLNEKNDQHYIELLFETLKAISEKHKMFEKILENGNLRNILLNAIPTNNKNLINLSGFEAENFRVGKNLQNINFRNSKFINSGFEMTSNINFTNAIFTGPIFTIRGANRCNFRGAQFIGSHSSGLGMPASNTSFAGADLTNTNFKGCRMPGVNFSNANLTNANLENAEIQAVNFENANLTQTNLAGVVFYHSRYQFNLKGITFNGTQFLLPKAFENSHHLSQALDSLEKQFPKKWLFKIEEGENFHTAIANNILDGVRKLAKSPKENLKMFKRAYKKDSLFSGGMFHKKNSPAYVILKTAIKEEKTKIEKKVKIKKK